MAEHDFDVPSPLAWVTHVAGEPLHWEHRRLLHKILSSASSTPASEASSGQLNVLQHTQSTAADVAARLLFRKAPSMSMDRLLNASFGANECHAPPPGIRMHTRIHTSALAHLSCKSAVSST